MNHRCGTKTGLALGFFIFCFLPLASAKTYTDKELKEMIRSMSGTTSHGVMVMQRQRLQKIMDGFIIGDPGSIKQNADELEAAMKEVVQAYPQKDENDAIAWDAMADIVSQAQLMKKELSKREYQKAYGHYTHIVASCIQCHQAARSWGKFEEPEPEAPEEKKAETSKDPKGFA